MPKPQKDDRDVLEILKFELRFLEEGGYGQSPHAARRVSLVFEDSLTCMNFNSQDRTPCNACLLMKFVPSGRVNVQIEEAVGNWLRATIHRLEQERGSASS